MIVRIRFGRGPVVTHRKGKNIQAARLTASVLTLISIPFGIFSVWRIGQDLGVTGDFVFSDGLLSHWQVWVAATGVTQYGRWRLARYSKVSSDPNEDLDPAENLTENAIIQQAEAPVEKATARI
jgi:hypothetical protein